MDAMRQPGADIGREIATGERADIELENFISRRHEQRVRDEGERPSEEAWTRSERLYDARRRAENRAAWCEYHRGQAERHRRNLGALVAHHEAEAERLMQATERRSA